MPTTKRQQLDIKLQDVKDPAVRSALASILESFNQLSQDILVSGSIKARRFDTLDKKSYMDQLGRAMFQGGIVTSQLGDGGFVKFVTRKSTLDPSTGENIQLADGASILGAVGMTSINGGNSGGDWRMMGLAADYPGCYFSATDVETNRIRVFNFDTDDANDYRVLIFYTER